MRLIDADYLKEYCQKHRGNINFPGTLPQLSDIPTVDAIPISVLEDIKAEIEEISEPDYKYHGCGSDEMICEMKDVLEIIDKYIR